MPFTGVSHKVGEHIDTDAIIPARFLVTTDPKKLGENCMEGLEHGWVKRVQVGDILVAERNFGCGSSREHAPIAILGAGMKAVIAHSFARIFYRNAFNMGLLLLEIGDDVNKIKDGDKLEVSPEEGVIKNLTTGETIKVDGGWLAGWKEVKIQLDPDYNELFSKEEVLAAGPREALPEYATDVTIGYRNPDGTKSLYVFASPIRYKNPDGQWSLIDSRIVNLRDEELRDQGYVYTIANSDVKSYFPKKATEEAGIRINRALQMDFGFLGGKEATPRLQTRPDFIGQEKNHASLQGRRPGRGRLGISHIVRRQLRIAAPRKTGKQRDLLLVPAPRQIRAGPEKPWGIPDPCQKQNRGGRQIGQRHPGRHSKTAPEGASGRGVLSQHSGRGGQRG